MADDRVPPPLFGDENASKDQDTDDLFTSASETTPPNLAPQDEKKEEPKDLFDDLTDEISLDSPEQEESKLEPEPSKLEPEPSNDLNLTEEVSLDSPEQEEKKPDPVKNDPPKLEVSSTPAAVAAPVKPTPAPRAQAMEDRSPEEMEEEESGDQYNIEITVTDPVKRGDGMSAYMAYKVITKTTLPVFKKKEMGVYRRFSDFLGLHEKLAHKHAAQGRVVPPPPEKSVVGMTKIKMSKEDQGSGEFVEKRRAALERFLNRTAKHPDLREDDEFQQFLEQESDLPKSSSTSALSGAGMMRLFSKVGDSIGKMAYKMDETDQWFEDKQQQIEALDVQLRKLHSSVEALVIYRKDLSINTGAFAKSTAMLGTVEEHTALSRALSQLAEVEEKIDQLHQDQADADFFVFSELVKDYVMLISAVKEVFAERVKIFKNWKDAELMLSKKRDAKAKLELQKKLDKVPQAAQEITEWEDKVEKGQKDFENISKVIRKELARFEKQRVKDFKNTIVNYLESLMNNQQQLIKYWEAFLPEAKAIA